MILDTLKNFFSPSPDSVRGRDILRELYLKGKKNREELKVKFHKALQNPNDPESVEVISELVINTLPVGFTKNLTKFSEGVIKKVASSNTEKAVLKALSKFKLPKIVLDKYVKRLSTETDEGVVKQLLEQVSENPISKLSKAATESKPLRAEIESLQSKERAKRFASAEIAQTETGGQGGYFRALSKLKGELLEETPNFEPLKNSLKGDDIGKLYDVVQTSPTLRFTDKLVAQRGLTKLLDGHAPVPSELKVMEEVFGSDVVRAIYDKRPFLQKIKDVSFEILADVPRALKTTGDMSATLRQGIVLGIRNPRRFGEATKTSFNVMINNNAFEKYLDTIKGTPEFYAAKDAGLHLSDPRKLFGNREEFFMSNLAEKIPLIGRVVKASNRAYVGFTNSLRLNVFNDLAQDLSKTNQASRKNLTALADFINTASGRGSLGDLERHATLLSQVFFAPRYVMSRVQFLNPLWYYNMEKPIRMEALKTFGSFVGTVGTIITLAKLGGADIETSPLSSDFGKMKIGNTRYDLTAGFGLYIRVFAQMASQQKKLSSGEIVSLGGESPFDDSTADIFFRALRSKLAPLPASTINLMVGKNVIGEDSTIPKEVIENTIPLYLQDMKDAVQDRGWDSLLSVGLPAFFGVGVQTYGENDKMILPTQTPPRQNSLPRMKHPVKMQ